MQEHIRAMACAALVACVAAPAAAQTAETEAEPTQEQTEAEAPTAQTVLATVNGTDITLGHMITAMATLPPQYQDLEDSILYNGILQQLVQQTALAQSFEGEIPARITIQLENERRSLVAGEMIEKIMQRAVTEAEVQEVYDSQYGSIDPEEEFNASHILVETEEDALAIKSELDGGADFAATAVEKSTGPSGPNGGELGWFTAGMMVPSFEAATIALEIGEVSGPVQTQFGWHVIRLNDTRKKDIPTLEDVRGAIENSVREQAAQEAIDAVTEAADITLSEDANVDPSLIRNLDLLGD